MEQRIKKILRNPLKVEKIIPQTETNTGDNEQLFGRETAVTFGDTKP